MNWGYKIIFSFIAFTIFLGVLVYKSFQSKVNLVSQDYYKQEIVFQDQINKIENELALEKSVSIVHNSRLNELLIIFPRELEVKSASLTLYRPSDASMDRSWDLQLDQENADKISTESLSGGLWQVQVEWSDQSNSYYKEQNIFLP